VHPQGEPPPEIIIQRNLLPEKPQQTVEEADGSLSCVFCDLEDTGVETLPGERRDGELQLRLDHGEGRCHLPGELVRGSAAALGKACEAERGERWKLKSLRASGLWRRRRTVRDGSLRFPKLSSEVVAGPERGFVVDHGNHCLRATRAA